MALSVVAAHAPISRISISVAGGPEVVAVEEERPVSGVWEPKAVPLLVSSLEPESESRSVMVCVPACVS